MKALLSYWAIIQNIATCGLFSKCGPLLVIEYITAPNIHGYQTGTLILQLPMW